MKFKDYKYVGDPINVVKIFNEKEVDEIVVVDIDATRERRGPDIKKIADIASEAFMPMAYGGGITSLDQVKKLFYNGIEKIILNKSAFDNPGLISEVANLFGTQSIVVSIDVRKHFIKGERVYTENGKKDTGLKPVEFAKRMETAGAGELLLNNIDRDGTFAGYDIALLKQVTKAVQIPVVSCGGAGSIADFEIAIKEGGASAVAAGSYFIFQRPHNAVLITYPSQEILEKELFTRI